MILVTDRPIAPPGPEGTPDEAVPGFHAIVPAGGAGTRLWPLSRQGRPKFLLDLTGSGRTLLQQTWDRLLPLAGADGMTFVTGRPHAAAVAAQLPDLPAENLVAEPSPRDSAAAICLAAAVIATRFPDAVVGWVVAMLAGTIIGGALIAAFGYTGEAAKADNLPLTIGRDS